jgi:hypothetical protein
MRLPAVNFDLGLLSPYTHTELWEPGHWTEAGNSIKRRGGVKVGRKGKTGGREEGGDRVDRGG